MADINVFAVLTPYDDKNLARDAFRLPENAHGYSKITGNSVPGIAKEPIIDSREATPAIAMYSDDETDSSTECIMLRLDSPPKDPARGWQFGTNPRVCDFLLGHRGTQGVSQRHFSILVTQSLWVEFHDKSTYGSRISHDGQAQDVVIKDDKRLLSSCPGGEQQWKELIVHVPNERGLEFRVEFPNHHIGRPGYWAMLRKFIENGRSALPSVDGLGLDSNPSTAPASRQPWTSRNVHTYLDNKEIGRGQFASVVKVTDARDGRVYASKKFVPPLSAQKDGRKRKLDQENWLKGIRKEYMMMENIPHPNIVAVVYFQESPSPAIVMEYCSLGSLQELRGVQPGQYISASRQMLLGLSHLHKNQVAHRDLKPANLLVASLQPFRIKISDFGLSKVVSRDGVLRTFCGTAQYAAPEVDPSDGIGYRSSIDIWSAGVIILEFIFGLPTRRQSGKRPLAAWIRQWANAVLAWVNELGENNDQVIDIVKHMVKVNPEERFTADECLQRGCEVGLFKRRSDGQIVDTDAPLEDDTELATTFGTDDELSDRINSANSSGAPKPPSRITEHETSKTRGSPNLQVQDTHDGENNEPPNIYAFRGRDVHPTEIPSFPHVLNKRVAELKNLIYADGQVVADHAKQGCQFQSDDYFQLPFRTKSVAIRKDDCRLNATQILRIADITRGTLVRLRQSGVPFDVKRGCSKSQGTYIDFEVGLQLCRSYTLTDLEELLGFFLLAYAQYLEEINLSTDFLPKLENTAESSSLLRLLSHQEHQTARALVPASTELDTSPVGYSHASFLYPISFSKPVATALQHQESDVLEDTNPKQNPHRSVLTDPSYSNGSYLPLFKDQSYLQPVHPSLGPPSALSSTYVCDEWL